MSDDTVVTYIGRSARSNLALVRGPGGKVRFWLADNYFDNYSDFVTVEEMIWYLTHAIDVLKGLR